MKKLTLPAVLITLCTAAGAWANSSSCIYDGIKYSQFDTISITSPEYTQELKESGYSADGYTLVLACSPVIDTASVAASEFTMSDIPSLGSAWIPLSSLNTHKPNTSRQLTSTDNK